MYKADELKRCYDTVQKPSESGLSFDDFRRALCERTYTIYCSILAHAQTSKSFKQSKDQELSKWALKKEICAMAPKHIYDPIERDCLISALNAYFAKGSYFKDAGFTWLVTSISTDTQHIIFKKVFTEPNKYLTIKP